MGSAFGESIKTHVEAMKASGKPEVLTLDHGEFTCSSCNPEIKLRVDVGAQKVPGYTEFDSAVVAVRDPSRVELVEERNGKHVRYYHYVVSPDGKTLTVTYSDYSGPRETGGGYTAKRVAAGPPGAHAISGSWQIEETKGEEPKAAESKTAGSKTTAPH